MSPKPHSLARKSLFGLAAVSLAIWLLLFACAGSLSFWPGWVYWLNYSLCSLALTLYFLKNDPELIERRLRGGPTAEKERVQKVILAIASVLFIAGVVVPGLDYRFQWSHVPAALVIVANVAVAAGFYIVFLVFRENSFASAVVEVSAGQKVIDTGPYRLVRHPMYTGALLMQAAAPLALGSYWAISIFPLLFAVISWRLRDEERLLVSHLPGYAEYRANHPYRLIPGIW